MINRYNVRRSWTPRFWLVAILLAMILVTASQVLGQITDKNIEISQQQAEAAGVRASIPQISTVVYSDTIRASSTSGRPGTPVEIFLIANNSVPVNYIRIPLEYPGDCSMKFDSFSTVGCRTEYFENQWLVHLYSFGRCATIDLTASQTGTSPDLQPGIGLVAKLHFTIPFQALEGQSAQIILDGYLDYYLPEYGYRLNPEDPLEYYGLGSVPGEITVYGTCCTVMGDANHDGVLSILDFVYLREYLHKGGPEPLCYQEGDVNGDGEITNADLSCLAKFFSPSGSPCVFVECQ